MSLGWVMASASMIGMLAVACFEEVQALVEFLDGAPVRQQRAELPGVSLNLDADAVCSH